VALGRGGAGGCLDTHPFFLLLFSVLAYFLAACSGSILDLYLLFLIYKMRSSPARSIKKYLVLCQTVNNHCLPWVIYRTTAFQGGRSQWRGQPVGQQGRLHARSSSNKPTNASREDMSGRRMVGVSKGQQGHLERPQILSRDV
jgi:hypothetical protein